MHLTWLVLETKKSSFREAKWRPNEIFISWNVSDLLHVPSSAVHRLKSDSGNRKRNRNRNQKQALEDLSFTAATERPKLPYLSLQMIMAHWLFLQMVELVQLRQLGVQLSMFWIKEWTKKLWVPVLELESHFQVYPNSRSCIFLRRMSIKFNLQEKSTLFNFAQKFETRFLKIDEFIFAQPASVRNSCPCSLFLSLSISSLSLSVYLFLSLLLFCPLYLWVLKFFPSISSQSTYRSTYLQTIQISLSCANTHSLSLSSLFPLSFLSLFPISLSLAHTHMHTHAHTRTRSLHVSQLTQQSQY